MILYVLDLLGVVVFAVSGALAAGRKNLDWVGVVVLAIVTAIGGGTLRDILLNREAVFWIADPTYLWVILASAFLTIGFVNVLKPRMKFLLVADALGLALFTIIGAQVAEAEGAAPLVVAVMGILTGVAGGVFRDILVNEIPLLFRPQEPIYSVAALAGVTTYLLLQAFGLSVTTSSLLAIGLIALLRLAAIFYRIQLPTFRVPE